MQYRHIGNSDLLVSDIGLDTQRFGDTVDRSLAVEIVAAAADRGINFVEAAHTPADDMGESILGDALRGRRGSFLVSASIGLRGGGGFSPRALSDQLDTCLQRLRTTHVDLLQIDGIDLDTPLENLMSTLEGIVGDGKARHIGAVNLYAWQLCHGNDIARRRHRPSFVSLRAHYSMLERDVEHEVMQYCRKFEIGLIPSMPLGGGLLSALSMTETPVGAPPPEIDAWIRPHREYYGTAANHDIVDKLAIFANRRGRELSQLAVAWLLTRPVVSTVVVGATTLRQVEVDAEAADWKLSASEMRELERIFGVTDDEMLLSPRDRWSAENSLRHRTTRLWLEETVEDWGAADDGDAGQETGI